jgi:hypothetical protein
MRYTVRRFVPDRFVGVWSGEELGYSESIEESRQYVPSGWKLVSSDDKTNYPEEITISDDMSSLYNSSNGKTLTSFYERYIRTEKIVS